MGLGSLGFRGAGLRPLMSNGGSPATHHLCIVDCAPRACCKVWDLTCLQASTEGTECDVQDESPGAQAS